MANLCCTLSILQTESIARMCTTVTLTSHSLSRDQWTGQWWKGHLMKHMDNQAWHQWHQNILEWLRQRMKMNWRCPCCSSCCSSRWNRSHMVKSLKGAWASLLEAQQFTLQRLVLQTLESRLLQRDFTLNSIPPTGRHGQHFQGDK